MYEMAVKNQNSQYLSIMLKIKKRLYYTIKEVFYKVYFLSLSSKAAPVLWCGKWRKESKWAMEQGKS